MSTYKIRFEGPAALALDIATALADADGVELTSSDSPLPVDDDTIALHVTVVGPLRSVAGVVDAVRDGLPAGATIDVLDD